MRFWVLSGIALMSLLLIGAAGPGVASANPAGLSVDNQTCVGGLVQATLHWSPDSAGQQYVDLSGRNDNFTGSYSTGGPYPVTQTQASLTQLQPNSTYYVRVSTLIGSQFLRSATLQFTTRSCGGGDGGSTGGGTPTGGATAPIHLQGAAFSTTQARFQWVPGIANHYFCLDYAKNLNDLFNLVGSWRNSGCGTTSNSVIVSNLSCGTKYFARVWTSAGGGLYSSVTTIQTSSCANAISPPTGLAVIFVTQTTARLDWDAGKDNVWFCIDTARSQSDLLNTTGSWSNHACWTTSTQATISGLKCGTVYYWRVYAWNQITNVHSGVSTFATDDCNTSQKKAPIEDVDVTKVGSEYHAKIVVGRPNACYSFGSYTAEVSGNVIKLTVYNKVVDAVCAQAYSTYTLTINLGSNYISGVTYIVVVNDDESDVFTAS